jgi:crotonobetainyl-CoA:carnitine CoA-transferase CaiB-like acyl-CoA transferase
MLIKRLSNSSGVSEATIESVIGFSPTVIIPASNDDPKALGSVANFLYLFKKNQSEEEIKAQLDKHDARVKARRDKHDANMTEKLAKMTFKELAKKIMRGKIVLPSINENYEIIRSLGVGAFGFVVEAVRKVDQVKVYISNSGRHQNNQPMPCQIG